MRALAERRASLAFSQSSTTMYCSAAPMYAVIAAFRGASGHASEHLASRNEKSRSAAKIRANLSGAAAQETGIGGDHFPSFRRSAPVARPDFLDEVREWSEHGRLERVQCEHPRDALADLLAQNSNRLVVAFLALSAACCRSRAVSSALARNGKARMSEKEAMNSCSSLSMPGSWSAPVALTLRGLRAMRSERNNSMCASIAPQRWMSRRSTAAAIVRTLSCRALRLRIAPPIANPLAPTLLLPNLSIGCTPRSNCARAFFCARRVWRRSFA